MNKKIIYRRQIKRPIYNEKYEVVKIELKTGQIYNIDDVIVSTPQNDLFLNNRSLIRPKKLETDRPVKNPETLMLLRNDLLIPITYNKN